MVKLYTCMSDSPPDTCYQFCSLLMIYQIPLQGKEYGFPSYKQTAVTANCIPTEFACLCGSISLRVSHWQFIAMSFGLRLVVGLTNCRKQSHIKGGTIIVRIMHFWYSFIYTYFLGLLITQSIKTITNEVYNLVLWRLQTDFYQDNSLFSC